MTDPYKTPESGFNPDAAILPVAEGGVALEQVRTGQRFVIFALLANLLVAGLRVGTPGISMVLGLFAMAVSIVGVVRMTSGLRYGTAAKIACVVFQLVPFVNLLVLVSLNVRATKVLREAGYTVGLLGAKSQS